MVDTDPPSPPRKAMTPRQVAKWLALGRMVYAKNQAAEREYLETRTRVQAAAKAAKVQAIRGAMQPRKISPGQVAAFALMPQVHLSLRGFGFSFALLVQTLAQALLSVGLLPPDHPARTLDGAKHWDVFRLLAKAKLNLLPVRVIGEGFPGRRNASLRRFVSSQYLVFTAIIGLLTTGALALCTGLARLVFGVAHAFAQTGPSTQNLTGSGIGNFPLPASGDLGAAILDAIFGTGSSSQSLVISGLGTMFAFYSNMILVFAGILLLWILISALAETLRTGVPLGKQFNHVWAPLRLIVALALLIPLGSGLNSGQWIVLSLAKWGSQQATQVWSGFAGKMIAAPSGNGQSSSGLASVPLNISSNRQFADALFQSVLCQQVNNAALTQSAGVSCSGDAGSDDPRCVEQTTIGTINLGPTVLNAGVNGASLPTPPANQPAQIKWQSSASPAVSCGGITVQLPSGAASAGSSVIASSQASQAILIDQSNAAASLAQNMTPLAQAIAQAAVAGGGGAISYNQAAGYSQYQGIFSGYVSQETSALASTLGVYNGVMLNGLAQTAQTYGWIYAPVWLSNISAQNGQLVDNAQVVPNVTVPALVSAQDAESGPFPGDATTTGYWNTAVGLVQSWEPPNMAANAPQSLQKFGMIANTLQNLTSSVGSDPLDQAGTYGRLFLSEGFEIITPPNLIDCYQNPFASSDCNWLLQEKIGSTANTPANVAKYNAMMNLGSANGGATILPDAAGADRKFAQLQSLTSGSASTRGVLYPIGMIMISVGFLLYLLTLIPLARFVLGVLNWLIMVFEAELAVPLVALGFLRTEGEGFAPQQVQTSMVMLLAVILRPLLMTIALVLGLVAFNAIMELVNLLFAPTVANLVNTGATSDNSYLSLGVYMIFYTTLAYTLANSAFKAIDILPNYVMGWIGQRMESRVDDASMVQQQAQSYMQTMAYSARGADDTSTGYGRFKYSQNLQQEMGFVKGGGQAGSAADPHPELYGTAQQDVAASQSAAMQGSRGGTGAGTPGAASPAAGNQAAAAQPPPDTNLKKPSR